ncbi:MAG: nuclear transport factor 2 family protein [Thermoflexaceae bacterium]|nr:nuclear transport factor 2 family protein [Thermoflexaceae bacterium]
MATKQETNLEVGRQWNDLWNARDPAFWQLMPPGAVVHFGPHLVSLEDAIAGDRQLLAAMPDARREIVRELADEDAVVHHWRCGGRVAATGRLVEWEGSTIMRVQDGLIAEAWIFGDPADPRLE